MKDIKITPTMLAAGVWAFEQFIDSGLTADVVVRQVFEAMIRAPKQPKPVGYTGYLVPWVSQILELADAGKRVKDIIAFLDQEGVLTPSEKNKIPLVHGRHATLASGVRHVLKDYGRKPKPTKLADYSFRNFEIIALREKGLSLKEIGQKFGISGTQVRHITIKHQRKQERVARRGY